MASRFDIAGPEVALRTETLEDLDLYYRARAKKQQEELAALEQAKYSGNEIYNVKPDEAVYKLDDEQAILSNPFSTQIKKAQEELEASKQLSKKTLEAYGGDMTNPNVVQAFNNISTIASKHTGTIAAVNKYNKAVADLKKSYDDYATQNDGALHDGNMLGPMKAFNEFTKRLASGDINATFDPGTPTKARDLHKELIEALKTRDVTFDRNDPNPSNAKYEEKLARYVSGASSQEERKELDGMIKEFYKMPDVQKYIKDAVEYKLSFTSVKGKLGDSKWLEENAKDSKGNEVEIIRPTAPGLNEYVSSDAYYKKTGIPFTDKIENAKPTKVTNLEYIWNEEANKFLMGKTALAKKQATHLSKSTNFDTYTLPDGGFDLGTGKIYTKPPTIVDDTEAYFNKNHTPLEQIGSDGNIYNTRNINYNNTDYSSRDEFAKVYPFKAGNNYFKTRPEAEAFVKSNTSTGTFGVAGSTGITNAPIVENTSEVGIQSLPMKKRLVSEASIIEGLSQQDIEYLEKDNPGLFKYGYGGSTTPSGINKEVLAKMGNEGMQYKSLKGATIASDQQLTNGNLWKNNSMKDIQFELSSDKTNDAIKGEFSNRAFDFRKTGTMSEMINKVADVAGVDVEAVKVYSTVQGSIDANGIYNHMTLEAGKNKQIKIKAKVTLGDIVLNNSSTPREIYLSNNLKPAIQAFQGILKLQDKFEKSGKYTGVEKDADGREFRFVRTTGGKMVVYDFNNNVIDMAGTNVRLSADINEYYDIIGAGQRSEKSNKDKVVRP